MKAHVGVAISASLLWGGVVWTALAQDEARSVQMGVYTTKQAERGEKTYSERCQVCHQPAEMSTAGYMDGWVGQTAHDFFQLLRSTMPEDNPGSLKRREYADIVAYIFQLNGLPAGEVEMKVNDLKEIQIEGPFGTTNDK